MEIEPFAQCNVCIPCHFNQERSLPLQVTRFLPSVGYDKKKRFDLFLNIRTKQEICHFVGGSMDCKPFGVRIASK